jgi:hypothetical protein
MVSVLGVVGSWFWLAEGKLDADCGTEHAVNIKRKAKYPGRKYLFIIRIP